MKGTDTRTPALHHLWVTLAVVLSISTVGLIRCDGSEPPPAPPIGRIAFVSGKLGTQGSQISVMAADGSDLTALTSGVASNLNPQFSPDGKRIAFNSDSESPHMQIYIMATSGSFQTRVTNSP